jgi:hypothetical protein
VGSLQNRGKSWWDLRKGPDPGKLKSPYGGNAKAGNRLWYSPAHSSPRSAFSGSERVLNIDEELTSLDDNLRRLKVEYDIFFGGGSKKPPADIEWRVQNLLRKFSDGHKLNFAQRFRFNTMQQRYALFSALWQQKLRIKEEGYRRPQDAVLGIQGLRVDEQHAAEAALKHGRGQVQIQLAEADDRPFTVDYSNADSDSSKVEALFQALSDARKKSGENTSGNLNSFKNFVNQKTAQLRKEYGCQAVEYSVEQKDGQVRLKAKPKSVGN